MAGRVTLLILMTGLFAAAWSSDRDPHTNTKIASRFRPASTIPAVRETALRRWNNASADQSASTNSAWNPTRELRATTQSARHIPAGTYLVVNPDGRTERVLIAATPATRNRSAADHFVSENNGQRQHWIRMADSSQPDNGHETVVVVLVDRAEISENQLPQRSERTFSMPIRPALQHLLSSLVQAMTTLRDDSHSPMAADGAESVNR